MAISNSVPPSTLLVSETWAASLIPAMTLTGAVLSRVPGFPIRFPSFAGAVNPRYEDDLPAFPPYSRARGQITTQRGLPRKRFIVPLPSNIWYVRLARTHRTTVSHFKISRSPGKKKSVKKGCSIFFSYELLKLIL